MSHFATTRFGLHDTTAAVRAIATLVHPLLLLLLLEEQ